MDIIVIIYTLFRKLPQQDLIKMATYLSVQNVTGYGKTDHFAHNLIFQ